MLTLICGLPNAGKTTYSAQYDDVIHFDDIFNYQKCNLQCWHDSQIGRDVCVEGVYGEADERIRLLKACQNQSPKVCIWLDVSLEESIEREKNGRKRPFVPMYLHHVTFEPPTLEEGWDEIIRI